MGGLDYLEQLVLSPSVEETLPAHNRAERGKRGVEEKEGCTFELFSLLREMRREIKRRDEQFKEELRWRYENLAVENKAREENLATVLQ